MSYQKKHTFMGLFWTIFIFSQDGKEVKGHTTSHTVSPYHVLDTGLGL